MFAINVIFVLIICAVGIPQQGSSTQAFTEQPSATDAIIGDAEVILKCAVSNLAGDLVWQKDGEDIAHATWNNKTISKQTKESPRTSVAGNHSAGEYHLSLKNVILQDDGNYKCYATEVVNNSAISSAAVKLTIGRAPGPISISGSPSITMIVGTPSNLSCAATNANPPATMTWYRDGASRSGALIITKPSINDASKKLTDSKSVLTITPTKDDNNKTYECQATNMALDSPRKADIKLNVQYPPDVMVENLQTEDLREETIAVFRCNVDANPSSVTYAWTKRGENIPGESSSLEVALSRDDHQASIECAATNTIGTTQGSITIDVKFGPKIIEAPEGVSVDPGTPGSMKCIAQGNPTPTVKWTRLGSRATLSTMTTLQFDSVTESDIGVYVCTATVVGFDPVVSYGRLDINGLPEITSATVQKAKLKRKAKLECFTGTKPDPHSIVWSWEGGQLQAGTKGRHSVMREETRGGVQSILTINNVKNDDFMDYNCTMTNSVGSRTVVISLKKGAMDLIVYVIIGVVSMALFIFIVTIIAMVYIKRRLKRRREGKGKVEIEIVPRSDSEDSLDKPKRSGSSSGSSSKPRYADPHDYVPRRGSRDTHDTWDDPVYHPGSYNPDWRDSWRDRDGLPRRYDSNDYIEPDDLPHGVSWTDRDGLPRRYDSNDYIEPDDLPHGNLPEWKDNFDDDDKPRSIANDSKSHLPLGRMGSKWSEPPLYDEFKDRYSEDDEYEKEWPELSRKYSNDRKYSDDRSYSRGRDDPIYSNDPYYDDEHYYDRDGFGKRSDYADRGYDRLSNKGSDTSYDSKNKLATNV